MDEQIQVSLFQENANGAAGTLSAVRIERDAAMRLSLETARDLRAVGLVKQGPVLTVAMADPENDAAVDQLTRLTGLRIRPVKASAGEIERAINQLYEHFRPPLSTFPGARGMRTRLGTWLVQRRLITREQLREALAQQAKTGERLGRILVGMGYINRLALARALALQHNLPFSNLLKHPPDPAVVRRLDEATARRLGAVPLRFTRAWAYVAFAEPPNLDAVRQVEEQLGVPVRVVVTSEYDIERVLDRVHRDLYIERSTLDLYYRDPEESAVQTVTTAQLLCLLIFLAGLLASAWSWPLPMLIAANAVVTLFYLSISIYRLYVMYRGATHDLVVGSPPSEVNTLRERDLPAYSILVPLYREREVLPALIRALERLDYPVNRLDIKLLFEESDTETLEAAKALHPPAHFQFVVVPHCKPLTQPKACNYGLIQATGQYCVIYDAEDIPEPDQLKKAVVAFQRAPRSTVCLQAKLNYYNRNQNLLTRWFTSEYSMWFDIVLPGMDVTRGPIPLGGTSNHFITERLRELGAWDPYNVTEDADLGIRLHKAGFRTAMFDSTTFEEANSELLNWVRQRTRWVKGFMQTWLVHMRHPLALWRVLGPCGFVSFQCTMLGTPLTFLLNPIYWALTMLWFLSRWDILPMIFPGFVYYAAVVCLFFGNFVFMYVNVAGSMMRGYHELVRYALFTPIYWILMSIASWRALYQLFVDPFYWEKTIHGLHLREGRPAPEPAHG